MRRKLHQNKYLLEEKKQLSNRIRYLESQLAESNKKATLVERKSNDNLSDNVNQAITNIVTTHYRRYGEKRIGKEIADVVWSYNFMNGVVRDELSKRARSDVMKIFSPAKILRQMDLSSGSLNLQGVEIMRTVESGNKRYYVSLIPSSQRIKDVGRELARYADKIIPFLHFETESGEGIEFDNERMFKILLHTYSLIDKA